MTDANLSTDLFSQTNETEVNYLEEAKKKFNVNGELDVNGLARGKVEADKFIEQLKRELEIERQRASQGKSIEELLTALKTNTQQSNLNEEPTREQNTSTPISPSQEDLQKLIETTLENQRRASNEETNKATVSAKLVEVWGASASVELNKKARELGLSIKQLEQMGKESPKALFTLLGVADTPTVPGSASSVPRSSTSAFNSNGTTNGERGKSYYDKLYRENPKLRFDAKTTAQEHRDAIKLGEKFFSI